MLLENATARWRVIPLALNENKCLSGIVFDQTLGSDVSLNETLVAMGAAWSKPETSSPRWTFHEAEDTARMRSEGLWRLSGALVPTRQRDYSVRNVEPYSGESVLVSKSESDAPASRVHVFLHGVEAAWRGRYGRLAKEGIQHEIASASDGWRIHEVAIDEYERPIGILYHEDSGPELSVNRSLIAGGLAYDRREFASERWGLRTAEREVRRAGIGLWSQPEDKQPWRALDVPIDVTRVVDGDSIRATVAGGALVGQELSIRLGGIDAPESSQPLGRIMTNELVEHLVNRPDQRIRITEIDRYRRVVGIIYGEAGSPELSENHLLVRRGVAYCYREYADPRWGLDLAEDAARAERRGLWEVPDLERPWEYRKRKREESKRRSEVRSRHSSPGLRSRERVRSTAATRPTARSRSRNRKLESPRKGSGSGCLSAVVIAGGAAWVVARAIGTMTGQ